MTDAITNASSLEEVVEIINDKNSSEYFGGTDLRNAENMAGQYAYDAAEESGYTDDASIESHLDILVEAGAKFKFSDALQAAINIKKQ